MKPILTICRRLLRAAEAIRIAPEAGGRVAASSLLLAALSLPALAQAGIGEAGARHLLSRTGFGANPAQIAVYAPLDREAAVDRLLAGTRTVAATPPPAWVEEPFERPGQPNLSEEEKKALQKLRAEHAVELRGWWLKEIRYT